MKVGAVDTNSSLLPGGAKVVRLAMNGAQLGMRPMGRGSRRDAQKNRGDRLPGHPASQSSLGREIVMNVKRAISYRQIRRAT